MRKFLSERTLENFITGYEQYKSLLLVLEPMSKIAKLALRGRLHPSYVKDGIKLTKARANVVT